MTDMETACACTLNRIFGFQPRISGELIRELGSCRAVFELPEKELKALLDPGSKYFGMISRRELDVSFAELERLGRAGYRFLHIGSPGYPPLLRDCEDAPVFLYIRSTDPPEEVFSAPMVSIVGTRDISPYGKEWCTRTVAALSASEEKPVIVSGMAIGVDITAQMAALGYGLGTVGVLPTGIDEIYPRQHCVAAGKIAAARRSALVTDYPPGTSPVAITFLRRNRIIAALSSATILIESKVSGGGMMTARLAASYGRDVLALPGRVDDIRSGGCNQLIGEKIAEPMVDPEAVVSMLGLTGISRRRKTGLERLVRDRYAGRMDGAGTDDLVALALKVKAQRGITVEELGRALGWEYQKTAILAGILENDGFIETDLLQRCTINFKKA